MFMLTHRDKFLSMIYRIIFFFVWPVINKHVTSVIYKYKCIQYFNQEWLITHVQRFFSIISLFGCSIMFMYVVTILICYLSCYLPHNTICNIRASITHPITGTTLHTVLNLEEGCPMWWKAVVASRDVLGSCDTLVQREFFVAHYVHFGDDETLSEDLYAREVMVILASSQHHQ